jgi:hypothetical protein
MSKVVLKTRGVDDFGREQICGLLFKYSHHYPRVEPDDIILYWDPKDLTLGMYVALNETEYYYKDGFQYCAGRMLRYLDGNSVDFEKKIRQKDEKLADEFASVVNGIAKKYNL